MADEPKDLRIPIYMSGREVEAIDKWRFENHIATRAQAVRRLVQMGLGIDDQSQTIMDSLGRVVDHSQNVVGKYLDLITKIKTHREEAVEVASLLLAVSQQAYKEWEDMRGRLAMIHSSKAPGRGVLRYESVKEAIAKHEERVAKIMK